MTKKKEMLEMEDQILQEDDLGPNGSPDSVEQDSLEDMGADIQPEFTGEESSVEETGEPVTGGLSAGLDSFSSALEDMDSNKIDVESEDYLAEGVDSAKPKRSSRKKKGDAAEEM